MKILSVAEAAALLSERGVRARDGGPVKEDTLRYWLQQGKFPSARCFSGRRGFWVIPLEDVETFLKHPE
jgi:hypothetical protein